jgi:hypothetical protein
LELSYRKAQKSKLMNEQTYSPREQAADSGGLGGIFDDGLGDDGLATVSSGPYAEQLPVANMTVGAIRARFRDRFDIDPRSQAVLAGNEVGDETIVRPGQLLMFLRRAGEKGARREVPPVTVTSGPYAEELPLANLTVREIRAR